MFGTRGSRKGMFPTISIVPLFLLCLALSMWNCGCREAEHMQSFADQVIFLIRDRLENGSAAASVHKNLSRYIESGFSDLECARKAVADLGQLHEIDLELLRRIETMREPDAKASDILLSLRRGFQEIDNGNYAVKKELENAERQDPRERAGFFRRILPALEESALGLQTVQTALGQLQQYMRENQLEGVESLYPLTERLAKEKALADEVISLVRRAIAPG